MTSKIDSGSCPKSIDCDFNEDMCGWTSDYATNWYWDQGFGRVERSSVFTFTTPITDRLSPSEGMFMYSDFTQLSPTSPTTMTMYSEYVAKTSGSCFTFYLNVKKFDNINNKLTIDLIDQNG